MPTLSHFSSNAPKISEAYNIAGATTPSYVAAYVAGQYMAFVDNGNDRVYTSDDSGVTWNTRNPTVTNMGGIAFTSDFSSIILIDITAAGTAMRRSTDGGATWGNITNPTTGAALNTVYCSGSTFIALKSGASTEIARSTDSGATFSSVAITSGSHSFAASDGAGTWLVFAVSTTTAYKSIDDGATWSSVTLPFAAVANGAGYVNGKFRIMGANGLFADSATGGTGTWTTRYIGSYSAAAPSRTSYFHSATGNYYYFITNTGDLWKVHMETPSDVTAVPVINGIPLSVGYMLHCNGKIFFAGTSSGATQSILKISNIP